MKNKFTITITEKDRQLADRFGESCTCLLATAVIRRRIGKTVSEYVSGMLIDDVTYRHDYAGSHVLNPELVSQKTKPFYPPSVVGLKFTFVRYD